MCGACESSHSVCCRVRGLVEEGGCGHRRYEGRGGGKGEEEIPRVLSAVLVAPEADSGASLGLAFCPAGECRGARSRGAWAGGEGEKGRGGRKREGRTTRMRSSANLQDYNAIIEKPMDLGTIRSRLENGSYKHPLEFLADCRLVFSNAQIYNKKGSDIFVMAETLSAKFEERWNHLIVPKVCMGVVLPPRASAFCLGHQKPLRLVECNFLSLSLSLSLFWPGSI